MKHNGHTNQRAGDEPAPLAPGATKQICDAVKAFKHRLDLPRPMTMKQREAAKLAQIHEIIKHPDAAWHAKIRQQQADGV